MKNLILVIIVSISFSFTSCNQKANAKNADTAAVAQEASVAPSLVDVGIDIVDYDNLIVVSMKKEPTISKELYEYGKLEKNLFTPIGLYKNKDNYVLFGYANKTYFAFSKNIQKGTKNNRELTKSEYKGMTGK